MGRLSFTTVARLWGRAPMPFAIALLQACLCCRSESVTAPQTIPVPKLCHTHQVASAVTTAIHDAAPFA